MVESGWAIGRLANALTGPLGTPYRSQQSVSRDGWTFSCPAAGGRLRLGASCQYRGAAMGGVLAARGGACRALDDPASRALSQPAARHHRGPHLRTRMATRLRQVAAVALLGRRDRPPRP